MTDGESTTPPPRRRPSYGLPGPSGPVSPAPGGAGGPSADGPSAGTPSAGTPSAGAPGPGAMGHAGDGGGHSAPSGSSPFGDQPQTGPLPPSARSGAGFDRPQSRRRGLLPLILGLVLLLVIGPVAGIGGLVWTAGSLSSDVSEGPTVMEGGSAEVEVPRNQMLIIYVPEADAEQASCTAEGTQDGDVSTVPSSNSVTFADGSQYVQVLGAVALQDTTMTVTCTETDAPAFLGPYDALEMAAPLLIGAIVAVVAGLVGLVLTIVGIVLLVRSRR